MFRIAGVQMDVQIGEPENNLIRIETFAREAKQQGTDLLVFPECALTGYCFESKEEALEHAIDFSSAQVPTSIQRLQSFCESLDIHVVVGMLEKSDSNLFNVAVCVGPSGLLGKYRKTHLPQLGVDHFATHGDQPYAVVDLGKIRIGMLICYDASFPEATRVLTLAGADLVVLPTAWPFGAEPTADYVVNARASENKVYFIAVDRVGLERGFQFIGKSKIADIHGNTLDVADHTNEAIIYAEIDPQEARNKRIERVPGKHAIDRLQDRRPDLYGPIVAD